MSIPLSVSLSVCLKTKILKMLIKTVNKRPKPIMLRTDWLQMLCIKNRYTCISSWKIMYS